MKRGRTFMAYVLPSVLAFALSGIYAIVDGFFVGNSVGDVGLSAINVVYPVVTLLQSAGTGIGMGGAVMWTVKRAEGYREEGDSYVRAAFFLLLLASIVLTVLPLLCMQPVLAFLGAEGEIGVLGEEYLRIMVLGAVFEVFATGLVPLIRNNGGASYAMVTMIFGFFTNIVLDYLCVWVWELGMAGAAWASVAGQAVTMAGALFYVYRHRLPAFGSCPGFSQKAARIVRIGVAPFGLSLSPMLSLLLMNRFSISYGGETAVASYACIAYGLTIVYLLMQGVGDGSQPLMSRHYGEGNEKELDQTRRLAYGMAWVLALLCMTALYLTRYELGRLFGSSEAVTMETGRALPIFLAGLLFYAFSRITTSGFYATEQSLFSYLCVYAEPLLLWGLLLLIPRFGGQNGVWWSMVLSQVLTALLAFGLRCLEWRGRTRRLSDI
ncbi:MAG: MATE family efflux transporter [Eubacteriales bacterium]|nr:MATE family efflux transporter [Eubacteriales bacterium]